MNAAAGYGPTAKAGIATRVRAAPGFDRGYSSQAAAPSIEGFFASASVRE
jgi:hypothetical protein